MVFVEAIAGLVGTAALMNVPGAIGDQCEPTEQRGYRPVKNQNPSLHCLKII